MNELTRPDGTLRDLDGHTVPWAVDRQADPDGWGTTGRVLTFDLNRQVKAMGDTTPLKCCTNPGHEGPNPLPISEFYKNGRGGLSAWCGACSREDARRRRAANPDKKRESNHRWYENNSDKAREDARRWRAANPDTARESQRRRRAANPDRMRESRRRYRNDVRARVFAHYGQVCACCGATERLTIDHIDGDGREHREGLFRGQEAGHRFYVWLITNGLPEGFQTLCLSCNNSKGTGPACRIDHHREGGR